VALVFAAGLVLHVGRKNDPEWPNLWAFYLLITLSIPVIFLSLQKNRVDRFLGDLTFPLYISHALVLTFVGDFVVGGQNIERYAALLLSLLLAVLLTLAVELPVERVRAAFAAWIMRPRQLLASTSQSPESLYSEKTQLKTDRGAVARSGRS
jgi:peptidoglycan/LPS O-acetylase OafA/YrhL